MTSPPAGIPVAGPSAHDSLAAEVAEAQCELLGEFGSFGWWLQVILFAVAFGTLVAKRYSDERPRPWRIWFMDSSKQGFGAGLVHAINMGLAHVESEQGKLKDGWLAPADACTWYFVNLVLDCSFGLALIALITLVQRNMYRKVAEREYVEGVLAAWDVEHGLTAESVGSPTHPSASLPQSTPPQVGLTGEPVSQLGVRANSELPRRPLPSEVQVPRKLPFLDVGEYGEPPQWGVWFMQLCHYLLAVLASKVTLILALVYWSHPIVAVATVFLAAFDGFPDAKLSFVMVLVPIAGNSAVLWVTDNFLRKAPDARAQPHSVEIPTTTRRAFRDFSRDTQHDAQMIVPLEVWERQKAAAE